MSRLCPKFRRSEVSVAELQSFAFLCGTNDAILRCSTLFLQATLSLIVNATLDPRLRLGLEDPAAALATPATAAPPRLQIASPPITCSGDFPKRRLSCGFRRPSITISVQSCRALPSGPWASSINFGSDTPLELDLYGKLHGHDHGSIPLVCWRNHLPLSECAARGDYNWYEIWGELNSRHCLLTGNIFYSPDYVNLSDREIYHNGSVSIPITS